MTRRALLSDVATTSVQVIERLAVIVKRRKKYERLLTCYRKTAPTASDSVLRRVVVCFGPKLSLHRLRLWKLPRAIENLCTRTIHARKVGPAWRDRYAVGNPPVAAAELHGY